MRAAVELPVLPGAPGRRLLLSIQKKPCCIDEESGLLGIGVIGDALLTDPDMRPNATKTTAECSRPRD